MPGTFAHITFVDTLCLGRTLEAIGLDAPIIRALLEYNNYCELGAVSPDYPYLSIGDTNAEGWANGMHYFHTADFIKRAVQRLASLNDQDAATQKGIAWLFGVLAHIVADLSVHPVINLIVGPYEQNKKEHRRCEAHQDAYIFTQMDLGDINTAEHISNCGITSCSVGDKLDPAISGLWLDCLSVIPVGKPVKSGVHGPSGAPAIDHWHSRFVSMIREVSEILPHLPLICRVFDQVLGIGYPEPGQLDHRYIRDLATPGGGKTNYDELFAKTEENIKAAWANLGQVLHSRDAAVLTLANADLDTGRDSSGRSVYWQEGLA